MCTVGRRLAKSSGWRLHWQKSTVGQKYVNVLQPSVSCKYRNLFAPNPSLRYNESDSRNIVFFRVAIRPWSQKKIDIHACNATLILHTNNFRHWSSVHTAQSPWHSLAPASSAVYSGWPPRDTVVPNEVSVKLGPLPEWKHGNAAPPPDPPPALISWWYTVLSFTPWVGL